MSHLSLHGKQDFEHAIIICFERNIQIQNIERLMHRQSQRNSLEGADSQFFDKSERSIRFQEISYDESQSRLRTFKNQVELSRSQLIEIVESQNFQAQAIALNKKGMEMIKNGHVAEAVILISQAQKILEYAANSGKEINRMLIISVLHNLACCHQQTWSLQKCSNYVQALIYNLNCEIKQTTDSQNQDRLIAVEEVIMNRELAQYYLLYCAINSQLKRNDAALIAAKKGNYLLKNSSIALAKLSSKARINVDGHSIEILKELGKLKTSTQDMNVEEMIEIANFFMYVWKNKSSFPNIKLKPLIEKLKDFSIGNVMQIQPRGVELFDRLLWDELSYQKILQRIVIVSMSFFTMATQLRLLAVRMSNNDKEKAKQMSQFRESQCYHLIAIILLLYYLPFDLLFLQHILASFASHYQTQIEPRFSNSNVKALFSTFLEWEDKDEVKRSTAFNSDKEHSSGFSRNSFQQAKNSHLKLQSDVRASLKGQDVERNRELAKLDNYYYVRQQNVQPRSKSKDINLKSNRMSHQSSKKTLLKRACATSKQSAQRTPVGYSPSELSPRIIKNFSKGSKSGVSSKNSSLHKCVSPSYAKKMSNVIDQYFTTQLQAQRKKSKKKIGDSKSKKYKENIESKGLLRAVSNNEWKGNNILNRQGGTNNSKQKSQLKGLKSPGKLRSKLQQARSLKKHSKMQNYQ